MTLLDWLSLGVLLLIFGVYSWLVDFSPWARNTLSRSMAKGRYAWFLECLGREMRMIDGQIMTMQQNGAAYFGSACLLGIGAAFSLLTTAVPVAEALASLPWVGQKSSGAVQIKALLTMLGFAMAFFQFSWAYRLFGYNAIALGGIVRAPEALASADEAQLQSAHRAAALNTIAGRHFNQAIRLFLFTLASVFWLIGAWALLLAALVLSGVMLRRQFYTPIQLQAYDLAWKTVETLEKHR